MIQARQAKKSETKLISKELQGHSCLCADGGLSLGQGLWERDVAAVRQQRLLLHTRKKHRDGATVLLFDILTARVQAC
jgi:hypothetical protein